jgi:hypothetical protein
VSYSAISPHGTCLATSTTLDASALHPNRDSQQPCSGR